MQLPIDVKAVFDAATDIEAARATPLSVSVYIDDTAPGDVVGHVRSAFASAGPRTRVTIGYLPEEGALQPYGKDDMAVLVAGVSERVGEHAAALRLAGVPVMVVTTMPDLVGDMASAFGYAIPQGDVVSPPPVGDEPIALDEAAMRALDTRMGEWIIEACREKKLAFALAFPFVRRPLSVDAVNATSMQNAGVGLVMFIPGADMPVMTLNQAKMLLQIAAAYGEPLGMERVKELAAVVGGAFALRTAARQVVALVPGLGWAVKAAIGYTGTQAMGRAAIEYFEGGGDIAGLAHVVGRARDKAVDAAKAAGTTPAGRKAAEAARSVVGTVGAKARETVARKVAGR